MVFNENMIFWFIYKSKFAFMANYRLLQSHGFKFLGYANIYNIFEQQAKM
jgi:hypothetical protein